MTSILRNIHRSNQMIFEQHWNQQLSKWNQQLTWADLAVFEREFQKFKYSTRDVHVYLHMIDPEFSLQLSDMIWFVIKKKIYTNSDHFKVFLAVLITECLRWVWWEKKYSMILEMHFWLCTFIFLKVKWVAKYMIQEVLK